MGDYCKRTYAGHISRGFQPANPVIFYIKNYVFPGLRDNQFNVNMNKDPWEHLTRFYETSSMCAPEGVTEDQVKLWLFSFSLFGKENILVIMSTQWNNFNLNRVSR